MEQSQKLLKVVGIYLLYFVYSKLASFFAQTITLMNGKAMYFIFDIFFLIFICFLYVKDLKKDLQSLKKNYNWKKVLKIVILYFLASLVINFILEGIRVSIFPNAVIDDNSLSIKNLAQASLFYAIFKAMIFGVIAEEILYREALSEMIKNKWLFIIISSLIYTLLPFMFSTSTISVMNLLTYFLPSLLISTIYVKNDRNIVIVMIMKFVYNLMPLAILISGLL